MEKEKERIYEAVHCKIIQSEKSNEERKVGEIMRYIKRRVIIHPNLELVKYNGVYNFKLKNDSKIIPKGTTLIIEEPLFIYEDIYDNELNENLISMAFNFVKFNYDLKFAYELSSIYPNDDNNELQCSIAEYVSNWKQIHLKNRFARLVSKLYCNFRRKNGYTYLFLQSNNTRFSILPNSELELVHKTSTFLKTKAIENINPGDFISLCAASALGTFDITYMKSNNTLIRKVNCICATCSLKK